MSDQVNLSSNTASSARPIKASDLKHVRSLKAIAKMLERLNPVGKERDKAGNRKLAMNDYCLLVLVWLFNPVVDSLRGLQQVSKLKELQKRLGISPTSLGSLSESPRVFDPELLQQIVEEWSAKLPVRVPSQFGLVEKQITAVDGSVFRVLSQIARLAWLPTGDGKSTCGYRLHAQFEVFRNLPNKLKLTPAKPKGAADERVVFESAVEGGRCYLADRGFEKYSLWNAIQHVGSDYVIRVADDENFTVVRENELSATAVSENVVSDQIVQFGSDQSRTTLPDHVTRVVIVKAAPHDSRRRKNAQRGPSCDGFVRIVTNNLTLPAELVAALYDRRWTIEMFFRILKQLLGCRHLLSHNENGVMIQIYMAMIACIMIQELTGKSPSKRTFEMLCFYFMGLVSSDELLTHLAKFHPPAD